MATGATLFISALLTAGRLAAQQRPPLDVGERLEYDVKFGAIHVGTGAMEVREIADVRGRATWHTTFAIRGGVPLFHVNDRMESWIDTATFSVLRAAQDNHERGRHRTRTIELYPERRVYVDARQPDVEEPSVDQPLDEGAFLFFLRTIPLEVGRRYDFDRYLKPDRNPVTLEVVRRERITVPAGTFETIVVRPTIKTKGIFSEDGHAEVWLTDDACHLVVQMKAKLSFGSINLYLRHYAPGAVIAEGGR
jgi:hypothetical protein